MNETPSPRLHSGPLVRCQRERDALARRLAAAEAVIAEARAVWRTAMLGAGPGVMPALRDALAAYDAHPEEPA
jgi:hypothetical protein